MTGELVFVDLMAEASLVVKLVMLSLALASLASWGVIIKKRSLLKQAVKAADEFESNFWSGGDLGSMYRTIAAGGSTPLGMAGIFEAGFRDFRRLKAQPGLSPDQLVEGSRRAMRVSQLREVDRLEQNLAMVAPGIAEALIATAMGLFAAIPAVIAFNRYADQVGRLEVRYDTFMEEFSAILQRHSHSGKAA